MPAPSSSEADTHAQVSPLHIAPDSSSSAGIAPARCCSGCGIAEGPGVKLSTCSKCKFATYCSRDCQRHAWSEHKTSCVWPHPEEPDIAKKLVDWYESLGEPQTTAEWKKKGSLVFEKVKKYAEMDDGVAAYPLSFCVLQAILLQHEDKNPPDAEGTTPDAKRLFRCMLALIEDRAQRARDNYPGPGYVYFGLKWVLTRFACY